MDHKPTNDQMIVDEMSVDKMPVGQNDVLPVTKVQIYPSGAHYSTSPLSIGSLPFFQTSDKAVKISPWTKALDYFVLHSVTKGKSFMTLAPLANQL